MFVTNQEQAVIAAKRCYEQYPTIVNNIPESGIVYDNTIENYAKIDNGLARSQLNIGWTSNLAQMALSYYWDELNKDTPNENLLKEYKDIFVELSVQAQVSIDSTKRTYSVSTSGEIDRIRKLPCMQKEVTITSANGTERKVKKDFPAFMRYTREIATTRNGEELPYEIIKESKDKLTNRINEDIVCPMNWLETRLDKIQGMTTSDTTPTEEFFIRMEGKPQRDTMSKIQKIIFEYCDTIQAKLIQADDNEIAQYDVEKATTKMLDKLRAVRTKNRRTINRIIEIVLDINNVKSNSKLNKGIAARYTKYGRQILNCLYKADPQKFLENFVSGEGQNRQDTPS